MTHILKHCIPFKEAELCVPWTLLFTVPAGGFLKKHLWLRTPVCTGPPWLPHLWPDSFFLPTCPPWSISVQADWARSPGLLSGNLCPETEKLFPALLPAFLPKCFLSRAGAWVSWLLNEVGYAWQQGPPLAVPLVSCPWFPVEMKLRKSPDRWSGLNCFWAVVKYLLLSASLLETFTLCPIHLPNNSGKRTVYCIILNKEKEAQRSNVLVIMHPVNTESLDEMQIILLPKASHDFCTLSLCWHSAFPSSLEVKELERRLELV